MRASLSASASPASAARRLIGLLAGLSLALIRGEDQRAVGESAQQPDPKASDVPPEIDAENLFALAVRAGSAVEMDWMWLYSQMTGSFERLYCLEKALARDPQNEDARGALRELTEGC